MKSVFRTEEGKNIILKRYNEFLEKWPEPNKQLTIPTSYGDTFVMASGKEDGDAVILIHGASTNAGMWFYDAEALGITHRVYAVDIIGEPGKSAQSRPDIHSSAYTIWLIELLDGLGIDKATVVGNSLGGWMALSLAINAPERIQKLILLAPAGFKPINKKFVYKSIFFLLMGKKGYDYVNSKISKSVTIPEEALAFGELLRKFYKPRPLYAPTYSDEQLSKLNMPVLFIGGEDDPLIDIKGSAKRLKNAVPQAQIRILKDTAHTLINKGSEIIGFLEENNSK